MTVPFVGVRFRASDVAAATGGRLIGLDVELSGASFDSRDIAPGQLFIPIVAERDGHDFVVHAIESGSPAYLTSRAAETSSIVAGATAIAVDDTLAALHRLAAWAREQLDEQLGDRVVGITGSVGKTSTKDLVVGAVGAARRVSASRKSFNNDQGLPVTVLETAADSDVLVLEMGMRGFGEIARLCGLARPSIGVVTAVGESHTGRVGGIEGVAVAKRELVEALPPSGVAVLNDDDERVRAMAGHTEAAVLRFGTTVTADVRIADVELDDHARSRFRVETPWGAAHVSLTVSGRHMAVNAAAAIAVAGLIGVPVEQAAAGLGTAGVAAMRMQTRRTAAGGLVINDAYNANPTSMAAALESLAALPARRKVAVLGIMGELDDPPAAHRRIASVARDAGIELLAVGTDLYGVDPCDDPVAALGAIDRDTAVLVKASRVAELDRLADRLI